MKPINNQTRSAIGVTPCCFHLPRATVRSRDKNFTPDFVYECKKCGLIVEKDQLVDPNKLARCCGCMVLVNLGTELDIDEKKTFHCDTCANISQEKNLAKKVDNGQDEEHVNHPQHYQSTSGLEVIDVIEAFNLDFHLGNAVKYILRAGKKGAKAQDLEKAKWYIQRAIDEGQNA